MGVTVVLSSSLKRFSDNGKGKVCFEAKENKKVKDILKELNIPRGEVGFIRINQVLSSEDVILQPGDLVELYPIFGGG